MYKFIIFTLLLTFLSACFKEEIPVKKPDAGNVLTNTAELGPDYRYQIYYDFESNSFVHKKLKTTWGIGFSCISDQFYIRLNSANASAVKLINNESFEQKTDTSGGIWLRDQPNGNLTETGCGELTVGNLYLFDLGFSFDGTHLGYAKLEVLSLENNSYHVKTALLDNSLLRTSTILKNDDYHYIYYSFNTGVVDNIAPTKNSWDICFTQYTHIFEDATPYLVTGVLSNRELVEVAEVFDTEFSEINFELLSDLEFNTDINAIGYDWKVFNGNEFTIDASKNYVIKNRNNIYFKIHFIDFYNTQGEKGFPLFEMQAL